MSEQNLDVVGLAADIVSAYVSNNSLPVSELSSLIEATHTALRGLGQEKPAVVEKPIPAISIKKSITPDAIICLEDGKAFKTLRRHLRIKYDLTPEQYREKWGLPADYPMVAPTYAEARSKMAKSLGLGRRVPKTPSKRRRKAA